LRPHRSLGSFFISVAVSSPTPTVSRMKSRYEVRRRKASRCSIDWPGKKSVAEYNRATSARPASDIGMRAIVSADGTSSNRFSTMALRVNGPAAKWMPGDRPSPL
jgi:hypothetical protein